MNNELGKYIRNIRTERGESLRDFAHRVGISHTHVDSIEKGVDFRTGHPVRVTNYTLAKLAQALGVSESFLFNLSIGKQELPPPAPRKKGRLPVLGFVRAGVPTTALEAVSEYIDLPGDFYSAEEYFGLRIKGDSMAPDFKEGDAIVVRRQSDVDSGDIAVVLVNGDDATVKKIKKHDSGISLVPLNPAYEVKYYTTEEIERLPVCIIGKTVSLWRTY